MRVIDVHFAPGQACEAEAVKQIFAAERTIRVRAYNFTSSAIREALLDAHRRGVDVQAIVDHVASTEKGCIAGELHERGIKVWIDGAHKIAHAKVIAIDEQLVLTGSYNWSESAKHNAENLLTIRGDAGLMRGYAADFETHKAHSTPLHESHA